MALDSFTMLHHGEHQLEYHDASASANPLGELRISVRVARPAQTPLRAELWRGRTLVLSEAALQEVHFPGLNPDHYLLTIATESALQAVSVTISPGSVLRVSIELPACAGCGPLVHLMPPPAVADRPVFRLMTRFPAYR